MSKPSYDGLAAFYGDLRPSYGRGGRKTEGKAWREKEKENIPKIGMRLRLA